MDTTKTAVEQQIEDRLEEIKDELLAERAELQALLPRTDAKAAALMTPHSLLLGLSFAITRAAGLSMVVSVAVWAAAVCAAGALSCSVLVIAPRMRRGRVRDGVTAPIQTPDELVEELARQDAVTRVRDLATHVIELRRINRRKFLLLLLGCLLLLASVALVSLAGVSA